MRFLCAVLVFACCLTGCKDGAGREAEVEAAKADLHRAAVKADEDLRILIRQIEDYVRNNSREISDLPLDVERYLWMRKAEFWRMSDALARHMRNNWDQIHKLNNDVARYYGYQVQNFPKAPQAILDYLSHADDSWRNLTQDVIVYFEYHNREFYKSAKWADDFWNNAWREEYPRLRLDVESFLEWREREYSKFAAATGRFFENNADLVEDFKKDLVRYRDNQNDNLRMVIADMRGYWAGVAWEVPRLRDDVVRFLTIREDPIPPIQRYAAAVRSDYYKMVDDMVRYKNHQIESVGKMKRAFQDFSEWRDREGIPLTADIRRYINLQIERGHMTMDLLNRLIIVEMGLTAENMADLQTDWNSFIGYSHYEWENFKEAWCRFVDYDPAFGGQSASAGGNSMVGPQSKVLLGGYINIEDEDFTDAASEPILNVETTQDSDLRKRIGERDETYYRAPTMYP